MIAADLHSENLRLQLKLLPLLFNMHLHTHCPPRVILFTSFAIFYLYLPKVTLDTHQKQFITNCKQLSSIILVYASKNGISSSHFLVFFALPQINFISIEVRQLALMPPFGRPIVQKEGRNICGAFPKCVLSIWNCPSVHILAHTSSFRRNRNISSQGKYFCSVLVNSGNIMNETHNEGRLLILVLFCLVCYLDAW